MEWATSLSQSAKVVIGVGGCRPKSCSRDGQRSCRFRKETMYEALANCSLLHRSLLICAIQVSVRGPAVHTVGSFFG